MKKDTKDFILACIASAIGITAAYLPNDMYILKAVGLIIYIIVLFKDHIRNLLSRRSK